MPKSRWGKACFALFVVVTLSLIGRNLYARSQRAALFRAAEQGDVERLQSLLRQGVDGNALNHSASPLHAADDVQETPLLAAARAHEWQAAHLLLEAGANANFHDGKASPLAYAVDSSAADMVRELLRHHADPDTKERMNNPVLLEAVRQRDVGMAEALLQAGANPNARDGQDGRSVLQSLVGLSSSPYDKANAALMKRKLAQLLVAHGADVNQRDSVSRYTPLLAAMGPGDSAMVELLLAAGADPNASVSLKTAQGVIVQTPLLLARSSKRKDIEELLTRASAAQSSHSGRPNAK